MQSQSSVPKLGFKHFSNILAPWNFFCVGKKEIIHNGNNEADDNDGWLVENDVQ